MVSHEARGHPTGLTAGGLALLRASLGAEWRSDFSSVFISLESELSHECRAERRDGSK